MKIKMRIEISINSNNNNIGQVNSLQLPLLPPIIIKIIFKIMKIVI